ncbi:hypothetical protein TI04_04255 [Achromatium sp. WMS2]|nr:hypothetical protein TI04_04255 [Achromatium sp. WMS2]
MLSRWLGALFVVMATYNPSGVSYWHWLTDFSDTRWSLKALIGLIMAILNMFFVLISLRSMRRGGLLSAAIFSLVVVWTLRDYGYLHNISFWTWITVILTFVGSIMGVGLSWSHIRGRLSGQADSNDVTI